MPGYVVKIQKDKDNHDNVMEYEMWCNVFHEEEKKKWLAEVAWISTNGRIMIQKKAELITDKNKKKIPEMIPTFLTDVKYENFGFIGKQFVCFDYAFSPMICVGNISVKRMKKFKSHLNEN